MRWLLLLVTLLVAAAAASEPRAASPYGPVSLRTLSEPPALIPTSESELNPPAGAPPGLRVQRWRLGIGAAAAVPVVRGLAPARGRPPALEWEAFATSDHPALGFLTPPGVLGRRIYAGESYLVERREFGGIGFQQVARIAVLDEGGHLQSTFFLPEWRPPSREGSGPGPRLTALLADPRAGRLYVAGVGDSAIRIFAPSGAVLGAIPLPALGDSKTSERKGPADLALGSDGALYLPDPQAGKIWRYLPETRAWSPFGASGQAPGEYLQPVSVATTPDGGLYVADPVAGRVTRLDRRLRYRYEIRQPGPQGRFEAPWAVAAAPDGGVVVAYPRAVARFEAGGQLLWRWEAGHALTGDTLYSETWRSVGLALSGDAVYLSTQDPVNRYGDTRQSLVKLSFSRPVALPEKLSLGSPRTFEGAGRGQFNHPCGIAVDPDGSVLVSDFYNHRVQKFDADGRFLLQFGLGGAARWRGFEEGVSLHEGAANRVGELKWPAGIALDSVRGVIYVADWGGRRIRAYDRQGQFLKLVGSGVPAWGLAVDAQGLLYASDPAARAIHVLRPDGTEVRTLGAAQGIRLQQPGMLAVSGDRLYVTDREADAVVEVDLSAGKESSRFGKDVLRKPDGIALDPENDGILWVADTSNHRVVQFNREHNLEWRFGSLGDQPAEFRWPRGLCVGPGGAVYVTDWGNHRVTRLQAEGFRPDVQWGSYSSQNSPRNVEVATAVPSGAGLFVGSALVGAADGAVHKTFGQRQTTSLERSKATTQPVRQEVLDGVSRGDRFATLFLRKETEDSRVWLGVYSRQGHSLGEHPLPIQVDPLGARLPGGLSSWVARPQLVASGELLAVSDPGGAEILLVDWLGEVRRRFGKGHLTTPSGLAAAPDGTFLVTDTARHRVLRFSPQGKLLGSFGKPGPAGGELLYPISIAAAAGGTLLVLDFGNRCVKRLDSRGRVLGVTSPPLASDFYRISAGSGSEFHLADGHRLLTGVVGPGSVTSRRNLRTTPAYPARPSRAPVP